MLRPISSSKVSCVALAMFLSVIAPGLCQQPSTQSGTNPPAKPVLPFPSLRLRDMMTADPQRDIGRAVARGDLRFVGVNGYGLMVPGVAGGAQSRIVGLKGINDIQGTSDSLAHAEQQRLQSLAFRYARRYNVLLLDHLRQSHDQDVGYLRQEIEAELTRMERGTPADDARKAIHKRDSRLLCVSSDDSGSDTPGLTREQSGEQPLHMLAFSPDLATEEQTRRMGKLLVSYVVPYNHIAYKSVPRRHFP